MTECFDGLLWLVKSKDMTRSTRTVLTEFTPEEPSILSSIHERLHVLSVEKSFESLCTVHSMNGQIFVEMDSRTRNTVNTFLLPGHDILSFLISLKSPDQPLPVTGPTFALLHPVTTKLANSVSSHSFYLITTSEL